MTEKINIPKEELKNLYTKEELSPYKIAEMYGCDYTTIRKRLKRYGLKSRSKNKPIEILKKYLIELYYKKGLSIPKIAKLYKCSQKPIWRKLNKYKIKIRKLKTVRISKKKLIRLYKIKKLKTLQIARLYKCSQGTIINKLHKHKISLYTNDINIQKSKLYEMYINKWLSTIKIAKKYNCSSSTIYNKLRQEGIKLRPQFKKIYISKGLLKKLYIDKQMPSTTISKRFKCSPTTIRARLKEHGIHIRNIQEVINLNKAIKIEKSDLEKLYLSKKLSCAKIANFYKCCDEVIRERLHKFDIPVRSNYETSTLYKKTNFNNNQEQKAYLIGFRLGDLHVQKIRKTSKTICIRCGSTKQAQLDLIKNLFSNYGGVWVSKVDKKGVRKICCHLDMSFKFLLKKEDDIPKWIRKNTKCFFAFFAGYLDAEGHIEIDRKNCAKLDVASYDKNILRCLYSGLLNRKIYCLKPKMIREKGYERKDGLKHNKDTWKLGIYRKESLLKTFNAISPYLKHRKRVNDMKRAMNNIIERNKKYGIKEFKEDWFK